MYHAFSSCLSVDHALPFNYALIARLMEENGPTLLTHSDREKYINKIARHIFDSWCVSFRSTKKVIGGLRNSQIPSRKIRSNNFQK